MLESQFTRHRQPRHSSSSWSSGFQLEVRALIPEYYSEPSDTGTRFSSSTWVFSKYYHSTDTTHSFIHRSLVDYTTGLVQVAVPTDSPTPSQQ